MKQQNTAWIIVLPPLLNLMSIRQSNGISVGTRSLQIESDIIRYSSDKSLKAMTEAETELARIIYHSIPLMASLSRPKRNKEFKFSDKRDYYTRKYDIVKRISHLKNNVDSAHVSEAARRNEIFDFARKTNETKSKSKPEEESGDEEKVIFPLDIHFHLGRKNVSGNFENDRENLSYLAMRNLEKSNNREDIQMDTSYTNIHRQSMRLSEDTSVRDSVNYNDDEWEETSHEVDGREIGLWAPPSPYAKNVSDINKTQEPMANTRDQISTPHDQFTPPPKQRHSAVRNQQATLGNQFQTPQPIENAHADLQNQYRFNVPLPQDISKGQRRDSQANQRPYDTAPANMNYGVITTTSQPQRKNYGYIPEYKYSYSDHYIYCQRQTVIVIMSFITLALLLAYLIIIATATTQSTGRKKRSKSSFLDESSDYNTELDGPTWISSISGIWDASDFAEGELVDVCTLKALCQMNRIASSFTSPSAGMMAFSSLPISYMLHKSHGSNGFTRYVIASLAGYNGFNCTQIFHSCPF